MENIFSKKSYLDFFSGNPCAVLPIGAFEQHGGHLPMTTDTLVASVIAKKVADDFDCLLLSPLTVSCSQEHKDFFGSVWISSSTLKLIVMDIVKSLEYSGIEKLIIINGHGGNYVLKNIAQEANVEGLRILLMPDRRHWEYACYQSGIQTSVHDDMHAGEIETSIMMRFFPELVQYDQIKDTESEDRDLLHLYGMRAYTDSGVIGYPSRATPEKGEKLISNLLDAISGEIVNYVF